MTDHALPRRRMWISSPPRPGRKAVLIPLIVLGVLVTLMIIIRLILDPIATHQTRKALNQLEGFTGDFARVHVTIFAPGYEITKLKLVPAPEGGAAPQGGRGDAADADSEPLLYVERAHVGVDWRELLRLRLVARLRLEEPKIVIVPSKKKAPAKAPEVPDLSAQLEKAIAAKVDRIEVLGGEVLFRDVAANKARELWVHRLELVAQNLATRDELAKGRPATVSAHGILGRSGDLSMFVSADPLASPLSFAGQMSLTGFRAREVYAFIAPETKLQASEGTIDVFAEFVAKNGMLTGGVKPVLKNIEIRPTESGAWDKLKAWLADTAVEVASDRVPGRNAVATTVPIRGDLTAPDIQVWPAVLGVIRNAFVQGLESGFKNVPPPSAEKKEGIFTQAKNALKKDEGPPKAQPVEKD